MCSDKKARLAVEQARQQVASLVNADAAQIIWTSGATESSNLAIKGVAQERAKRLASGIGRVTGHIITSQIEHKATLDTVRHPGRRRLISPDAVSAALRDDTFLVSLMLVNNELGTVNDIAETGKRVREHGALLHVDAAQGAGKLPIDLSQLAVDLMSFSAHQVYGPKGIGALYVGPRAQQRVLAQIHGGGHECGMRSGTLATHQIAGMGAAFALAAETLNAEILETTRLTRLLIERLADIPGLCINGSPTQRIANIVSLTFGHSDLDIKALGTRLAFSSTSACNSAKNAPSHVLLALGHSPQAAGQTIRLSIRDSLAQPAFWAVAQAR